jgi:N6-L-threonylcarbamoyladenine synthase
MLLAVETSCDETATAIVHNGRILASVVSSQVKMHEEYGGVVPELAAREHLKNLLPITRRALTQANLVPANLTAVASTQGPGLPGALMIGLKAAQAMAFSLRCPFIGIHHHEAHLYSPWIKGSPPQADFSDFKPNVSLIVSGGHTMLVHVRRELDHHLLGSTLDDAAGECFDKVGKLLGLQYPAGPLIDRLARDGNPVAFDFPRPMISDPRDDFSFSGLKTSVRYFLRDNPKVAHEGAGLADLCASAQKAIVDVLISKLLRAAKRLRVNCVTASGGVTCNSRLRKELTEECFHQGLDLRLADPALCTDNAAMIGILAERKLKHGPADLDADIRPSWPLALTGTV